MVPDPQPVSAPVPERVQVRLQLPEQVLILRSLMLQRFHTGSLQILSGKAA